jgi:hypothetical protein
VLLSSRKPAVLGSIPLVNRDHPFRESKDRFGTRTPFRGEGCKKWEERSEVSAFLETALLDGGAESPRDLPFKVPSREESGYGAEGLSPAMNCPTANPTPCSPATATS